MDMDAFGTLPLSETSSKGKSTNMPYPFTYIAFTVDPYASLQDLHDSEVDAVTKTMETKTYIGIVNRLDNLLGDEPDKEWILTTLFLLSPKPPSSDDKPGFDASFFLPVLPATDHPNDRTPAKPVPPLPWPGYHILESEAHIRLRKVQRTVPQEASELDEDSMWLIYEAFRDDRKVLEKRREALGLGPDGVRLVPEAEEDNTRPGSSGAVAEGEESSEEEILENEEGVAIMEFLGASELAELANPLADFIYEVGNIPELSDPADLFKQVEALEKLRQESNARAKEANRNGSQFSFHAEDGEQPTSPVDETNEGEHRAEEPITAPQEGASAPTTESTKTAGAVPLRLRVFFGRTKSVFLRVRAKFFSPRKPEDP